MNEDIKNTCVTLNCPLMTQCRYYNYQLERGDQCEVYERVKNAILSNVPKSLLVPKWHNRQVDTNISYADLARDGWNTVETVIDYVCKEKNKRE